jgi:magnesium chelatase subunit D
VTKGEKRHLRQNEINMQQYPFTAIVGQEKLKLALLLCAVNPGIGGVLIRGEKGTAKTTAARGLQAVMPLIKNLDEEMPVPFVDLPIGASEDRVLGSLDLQAILSDKKKQLLPGLLAAAHNGILYIDEVNLLPDHLVDVLLDVAASGINTIQREGISASHPARFILIGTMNPEEGNLRPQFLDRFGLMVEVGGHFQVSARMEVVQRRTAFEADPETFNLQWEAAQQTLKSQIQKAQRLLDKVEMPHGLLSTISQLCIESGVASLRADIVMYKTAVALAAFDGRMQVDAADVKLAAELVLAHRRSRKMQSPNANQQSRPADQNTDSTEKDKQEFQQQTESLNLDNADNRGECGEGECAPVVEEEVFGMTPDMQVPSLKTPAPENISAWLEGRRSKSIAAPKGFKIRAEKTELAGNVAVTETLVSAIVREPDHFSIQKEDLHQSVREGKTGHLILFVVDASGSMSAGKRMEAVKGSVLNLLKDAYQKRDRVGVIAFRGVEASILLEPTSSIDLAEAALETLPTGGRTPLAHALQLTAELLKQHARRPDAKPLLILLSDGKANVPLSGGGDAWAQTLELAALLKKMGIQTMVLDTENGYLRFGRAAELAIALGAECLPLDELSEENLTKTVSFKLKPDSL